MLFEGEMQVAPIDAQRYEDTVQSRFGRTIANALPAPIALGERIAPPFNFCRCFHFGSDV
jgi:hypothetical protein